MQANILDENRKLVVQLEGDWKIDREIPRFDELVENRDGTDVDAVAFDSSDLGEWDSSLAAFLMQGMQYCEENDLEFEKDGLPDGMVRLLNLTRAAREEDLDETPDDTLLMAVGKAGLHGYKGVKAFVTFIGELGLSFGRFITFRERIRWQDFWLTVQSNSAGALPIVTLISFLVGLIVAFLGAVVLEQFGAGYYVSYLVGFGMLRQMGALMTAIILTGRTGAAFAAELGSMKIMEEIDAYKTLGLSPIGYLVLPRILGLLLMMPLMTVYSIFIGILGGLVVAIMMLDFTATQFFAGLLTPVTLTDGLLGVFKGFVFGGIIGISGCMQGMAAGTDARSVGKAATSAVVLGITLIIVANAIIDVLAAILDI